MKLLFSLLAFYCMSIPSFANSQTLKPYFTKITYWHQSSTEDCFENSTKIADNIMHSLNATPLSESTPISYFRMIGDRCFGYMHISTTAPLLPVSIEYQLKKFGRNLQSIVDNSKATFITYTASIIREDGSGQFCTPRASTTRSFPNLTIGYTTLDRELNYLLELDKPTRDRWLDKYFACPQASGNRKIQLTIDLTNQAHCPLQLDTLNTCFIARGFRSEFFK